MDKSKALYKDQGYLLHDKIAITLHAYTINIIFSFYSICLPCTLLTMVDCKLSICLHLEFHRAIGTEDAVARPEPLTIVKLIATHPTECHSVQRLGLTRKIGFLVLKKIDVLGV